MFPIHDIKFPLIEPVKTFPKAPQTLDNPSTFILPKTPLFEGISLPFILKNLICFGPTETKSFSFNHVASRTLAPSTLTQAINEILDKFVVSQIAIEL